MILEIFQNHEDHDMKVYICTSNETIVNITTNFKPSWWMRVNLNARYATTLYNKCNVSNKLSSFVDFVVQHATLEPPGARASRSMNIDRKKLRNAARASRSMKIDRFWKVLGSLKRVIERSKKATKRRQGLTFHEHWSEKSSETPPGPHVPWKSIDFEKSWDHWKEW